METEGIGVKLRSPGPTDRRPSAARSVLSTSSRNENNSSENTIIFLLPAGWLHVERDGATKER